MKTFELGSGAERLQLGLDGSVARSGEAVGNWRTGSDNSIQVKLLDGTARTFAVAWAFNADNQLVLFEGSKALCNFQDDASLTPGFELRKGVLRVTPHRLAGFAFELRAHWSLSATHDLEFTLGERKSKLSGFISDADRKNRFLYVFADKKRPLLQHRLQFEGRWDTPAGGEANLRFTYTDGDGSEQVFELPGALVIDKTTNQLRYEYTKGVKRSIQFDGTLSVSPELQIIYSIGRSETNTGETVVRESQLRIGATLTKDNFTGNLEFEARRLDGGKTTLSIAGSFVGVVGADTKLAVGFTFKQVRASGQVTTTVFGFEGALQFKNGSTVNWTFASSNAATRTISLTIGSDIVLSDKASLNASLNLNTAGGKVQGVSLLLGVRF